MGGMSAGQYEGILGGTLGGIGDIVSSASYSRPKLKPATGMELRLRQLAQDQLLGGGQQLLGATALYNQMAPVLMGMLPGMHYMPGTPPGGGSSGGSPSGSYGSGSSSGGGGDSGPGNYQQALQADQGQQHLQDQLNQLNAQIKGAKAGQGRQQLVQQRKQLKQQLKGTQPANQLDRQMYMAGSQPGSFDIQQGPPAPMPSQQSSLGDINSLLGSYNQGPNLQSLYQNPGGSY